MYWFHPGAWWVARRLRIERELACDDRVIAAGTQARDYAGHLLEIAYSFGDHRAPALAVSMARPRQLEGRMLAALDDRAQPDRAGGPRARVAGARDRGRRAASAGRRHADRSTRPRRRPDAPPAIADAGRIARAVPPECQSRRTLGRDRDSASSAPPRPLIRHAQDSSPGTWEIRPTDTEGTVHLRLVEAELLLRLERRPSTQLEGLTAAQLTGAGGPVQFRLRRDAGTFTFEGVLRSGVGAGTFSFAADPNFPAELAKRGFARPTAREQYQMARHDVGYAFLDELNKQGYAKPQTAELVRAGQHGVQRTYLREMGALGYRLGSLEPLIELRDHGVTPAYVRELAELGYKGLPADELRRARDHGITPEYVRGMRDAGYGVAADGAA